VAVFQEGGDGALETVREELIAVTASEDVAGKAKFHDKTKRGSFECSIFGGGTSRPALTGTRGVNT